LNSKRSAVAERGALIRPVAIGRLVTAAAPDRQRARLGDRLDERRLARARLAERQVQIADERDVVGEFVVPARFIYTLSIRRARR